jgi:predicted transcriptional regulator
MELGLEIIKTRTNLWTINQRIKNARLDIEKKRPEAKEYIQGALQSEEELLEAISFFSRLYEHAVSLSRENTILASRNIELAIRVKELETELQTSKF